MSIWVEINCMLLAPNNNDSNFVSVEFQKLSAVLLIVSIVGKSIPEYCAMIVIVICVTYSNKLSPHP